MKSLKPNKTAGKLPEKESVERKSAARLKHAEEAVERRNGNFEELSFPLEKQSVKPGNNKTNGTADRASSKTKRSKKRASGSDRVKALLAEKELLINVNSELAAVRSQDDLFNFIVEKLQPVFGFNQYSNIAVYNGEQNTLEMFFTGADAGEQSQSGNQPFMQPFPVEGIFQTVIETNEIVIIDESWKTSLKTARIDEVSAQVWRDLDFKYALSVALRSFGKLIGTFHVHFFEEQDFTEAQLRLFKAISEQIAVAVTNILANEEILEREREKNNLLSISEALSKTTDRRRLLTVIYQHINRIFDYHASGLFLVNENENYHQLLVDTEIIGVEEGLLGENDRIPYRGSVAEFMARDFGIISTEEMFERFPFHPHYPTIEKAKVKEFIYGPLKSGDQTIGMLCFSALQQGTYNEKSLRLFKQIAEQVAVAVANILANENILEREWEKSQLLAISEAIAAVQNPKQLLKVIYEKIKPVFPYDNAGLFVFDKNGENLREILDSEVLPDEVQTFLTEAGRLGPFPITERHPNDWIISEKPVIDSLFNQAKNAPPTDQYDVGIELGLKQMIGGPLYCGGRKIGMLSFNSKQENFYSERDIALFKSISDLVAVAVANILANEEILEREREKSQLLEITELIAQVKSTDDLLKLLVAKIKPLFGFHDCGLFVLSADKKTHSDLAAVLPDVSPSDWNETIAAVSNQIPHKNSPVEWAIKEIEAAGHPILFDFVELVEKYPAYPQLANAKVLEMGYRDCLAANMVIRGEIIGMFCINALGKNFFQPPVFPLFQSVTHAISIALANILANEEISEREGEKSVLLSISEAIATIRDKDELWHVVIEKIKPLLGFTASVSTVYSSDYSQYCYFLFSGVIAENLERELKAHFNVYLPIAKTSDEWVMRQGDVCRLSIEEKERIAHVNPEAIKILKSLGVKQNLYVKLKVGGKVIGVQQFHFTDDNALTEKTIRLAQAITDLIAVAVANILANEDILEREREKEILLSITEAIAQIQDRRELFDFIFKQVQPLFGFNDLTHIWTIDAAKQNFTYFSAAFDQEILTPEAADAFLPTIPIEGLFTEIPQAETAYLRSQEYFLAHAAECEINQTLANEVKRINIQQVMIAPLRCRGEFIGSFHVYTDEAGKFTEQQLPLFQSIADQIAVTVSNIQSKEEIARLAEERRLQAEELAKSNEALARTSARLVEQPDLNAFLSQVVIETCNQLNANAGHLITLNEKRGVFQTATLVENGFVVSVDSMAQEMPLEESRFWFVLRETMKPRLFDIEEEPENFWRGAVEYLRAHNHRFVIAFPLIAGQKILGVMGIACRSNEPINEQQNELITTLSHQAALAIQLTRLSDEARAKAEESAILGERNRIAREIHDTLAQSFTGIISQLQAAGRLASKAGKANLCGENMETALELAREGLREARRSVQAIRGAAAGNAIDLPTALLQTVEKMTAGTNVEASFKATGSLPATISEETSLNLLRIGQEAVTNAVRHAAPRRIRVKLDCNEAGEIRLIVRDDGRGFDPAIKSQSGGYGLIGMRERAAHLGTNLKIKSRLGAGTVISVTLDSAKRNP